MCDTCPFLVVGANALIAPFGCPEVSLALEWSVSGEKNNPEGMESYQRSPFYGTASRTRFRKTPLQMQLWCIFLIWIFAEFGIYIIAKSKGGR